MRLNVQVHGLQFVVSCGEGSQTFKWLGLVAAQRYALAVPHGRCRTREDAHLKPGFFLPASVAKTQSGEILSPTKKISENCKDNESITVVLQQEVSVNEIGAPQFSAWAISAFASASRGGGIDATLLAASKSVAKNSKPDAKILESLGGDAEVKEYARSEVLQQVSSGQFHSDIELEAAFMYDWSRLRVEDLERDAKEREGIQELLLPHFNAINAAYLHYAVGSGETTFGLNGHELAHFLHECGLFDFRKDHTSINTILTTCLRHEAFVSPADRTSLTRVGFLHALLRAMLQSSRNPSTGLPKDVIEKKLTEAVVPTIQKLTTGPFRDYTHYYKIVAVFQEAKPKLLKLYTKYAQDENDTKIQRETESHGWPLLLPCTGLKSLLYDCGVFCVGDAKGHEELFEKAVEQCFSGMHDLIPEERAVVFSEFVEIIARVGMTVLSDNNLPPKDAIKITLDAIRTLSVKPTIQSKVQRK